MPLEKRDKNSKARLFIPTTRERSLINSQRLLDKKLTEVDQMKKEVQELLKKLKEQ
jgi:riboflavin synthase alpha subunit